MGGESLKFEISPGIVPSVLATLGPGEAVYAEHGVVLWKEAPVKVDRKTIKSGGILSSAKRYTVGGIPFFLTEFQGPGMVSFSRDGVGELRELELKNGETLEVGEGSLVCATAEVRYEAIYVSGTAGRMGIWMDQFTGPGHIVIHANGNLVTMNLQAGEKVVCEKRAILHKTPTMKLTPFIQKVGEGLRGTAMSQEMYEIEGPGRVALQTGR
ncbi:MAG: AIM24 family protein [Euryarchaeota archaeon]|nr:AIM24 family protein [Euryarchaeota archaeon]MDE1835878.1 AIM24 family protein [Euryarchaeota archaeon]MDE1881385.1 AIM24 family protein [Euryarchaeota archaeon]MDE2044444.1 AIM24 family protein [Thermoplasmata archaeon]